MTTRSIALLAGPLSCILIAVLPAPEGMSQAAHITAAITAWIAVWWITEPVNTAVTALLPLVLFPLYGILPAKVASAEFGNEIIFLFIAGFFFGKTIERWGLHRRIALSLVLVLGSRPAGILLGFMVATAFLSMWISNTATAVMMTPVAVAVAGGQHRNFQKALLLGVGYACSIGGLATIVGTPTNAVFLLYVQQKMGEQVSFWQWLLFGLPFAATLLLACWVLLIRMFPLEKSRDNAGEQRAFLRGELTALGAMTLPEKLLIAVFGLVILSWISGSLWWYKWTPGVNDTVVAVAGAIFLFLLPAGAKRDTTLLDWDTALGIPWGIVLFFGGGLALAKGFDQSGLAVWIGEQMKGLVDLPHAVILFAILATVVLLSEVASNIATASMMMPVLATLAASVGMHPFGLMLSATLAASFGFGLPVATAPNTIVYSPGFLTTRDMGRAGFLLDFIAVLLLLAFIYLLLPLVWHIEV